MKFRVFSDLHLDLDYAHRNNLWMPTVLSDDINTTLILAGDFWHGDKLIQVSEWLNYLARRFKHVVVVLGNHDYWFSPNWRRAAYQLKELVGNNVHVLEKQTVDIEGVRIGGATLWTDINGGDPISIIRGKNYTNDIQYIKGMTTDMWIAEFNNTVEWILESELDIIVTHYVPTTMFTAEEFIGNPGNCMFSTDLIERINLLHREYNMPKYWVFGHTHTAVEKELGNTTFICNPRGYRDAGEHTGFNEVSLYEF